MISPGAGQPASLSILYRDHTRRWHDNAYVYAVVSRRSGWETPGGSGVKGVGQSPAANRSPGGGLSIGINLNPDKACNFDCIYCQVDRATPALVRRVELSTLQEELDVVLKAATSGELFDEPPFSALPAERRDVADLAFSGDGEPTTYPRFSEAVRIAAEARQRFELSRTKLVLITDACYLTKALVRAGLRELDAANGEIWAKLDAGTEDYYRLVNRPNFPLRHVLDNIIDAARERPVVIQSLFMRVHAAPPPADEIEAYAGRLNEIVTAGGRIKLVQLYTIARATAEPYATMLSDTQMDELTARVRSRVQLPLATFYGAA